MVRVLARDDNARGGARGRVDGLDERGAAAAFAAVARGAAVLADGAEKIFERGLVTANVADGG